MGAEPSSLEEADEAHADLEREGFEFMDPRGQGLREDEFAIAALNEGAIQIEGVKVDVEVERAARKGSWRASLDLG